MNIYKQFSRDFFDLIFVDECHRGSAAEDSAWRRDSGIFRARNTGRFDGYAEETVTFPTSIILASHFTPIHSSKVSRMVSLRRIR